MEGARKAAGLLASWHVYGFESFGALPQPDAPTTFTEFFRRISALRYLDSDVLKWASHCGGIASAPQLGRTGFNESPGVIDPQNDKYGEVGRYLLSLLLQEDIEFVGRGNFDFFASLGNVRFGDYFEAYLAAAAVAYNRETRRPDLYYFLQGGSHGANDHVTPMITNLLAANPRTQHLGHGSAAG